MLELLLIIVAGAGAAFYLARGIQLQSGYRKLTKIEQKRISLEEAQRKEAAQKIPERLRTYLRKRGYNGDLFPFVAAMSFLYLVLLVISHLAGLSYGVGAAISLPLAFGVAFFISGLLASRRRNRFNYQLIELLDLLAGQIAGGNGAQKALNTVVPSMQEPLRSEMMRVLNTQVITKDLLGSMRELSERYPSRAMNMFIAALEIDRAEGHAIAPALRQAAELLKRDFALAAEAGAEISQTRGEFFAVIAIMGGICFKMLASKDPSTHDAYVSATGIIVVGLGLANLIFGVWRFLKILDSVKAAS